MFDEIAAELLEQPDVSMRKMFSHRALFVGRKVFAVDHDDELVLKLPDSLRAEALQLDGARTFEPMAGRPMKEWVKIPAEHEEQWIHLAKEAKQYVDALQNKS